MSVCCECYVLSGRGLCDKLITHPEESYRLWCVIVCDQETLWTRRQWPALGHRAMKTTKQPLGPGFHCHGFVDRGLVVRMLL
jgi:hypothetical protein